MLVSASTLLLRPPFRIDRNGQVFIGPDLVTLDALPVRLKALAQSAPDQVVYVRGDTALAYGRVMETMGVVYTAGFSRASLLAEQTPIAP